jgi:uncharacterized protein (TIGR00297 family)
MMETILIFSFIVLIALAGYFLHSLTFSGSVAAVIVGVSVYLGFDVKGLVLLGAFFATSSFWSKYKSSLKAEMEDKLEKGATRDWQQVAANGGLAAVISVFYYFYPETILVIAYCIAIGSANSDTWASEIGSLSKHRPMFVRTLKRVEKGTSGAISFLGTVAALGGAILIASLGFYLFSLTVIDFLLIFFFGFLGNIIDTMIGAFFQQVYRCHVCGIETEKKHHCKQRTMKNKGIPFLNNDFVNFLSGLLSVLLAIILIVVM